MQQAWLAFARTGAPSHNGLPHWPRYAEDHAATMTLGRRTGVVRGRSERERQVWEASFSGD
jgi:para-nitrobenzyl esterase